jgi:hypothetical protein
MPPPVRRSTAASRRLVAVVLPEPVPDSERTAQEE